MKHMRTIFAVVLIILGAVVALNFIVSGPHAFGDGWSAVLGGCVSGLIFVCTGLWVLHRARLSRQIKDCKEMKAVPHEPTLNRSSKTKIIRVLISIVVAIVILVLTVHVSYSKMKVVAKRDVIRHLEPSSGPNLEVELDGIYLSKTHLIRFSFSVKGSGDLSKAQWHAKPWGEVMVEK